MKSYPTVVRRLVVTLAALSLGLVGAAVASTPAQALPAYVDEIHNDGNGKCLDVATQNNYTVQLWNCTNHTEQQWIYGTPTVIDGHTYIQIVNWRTSKCLEPAGASHDSSVPVVVNPCSGADSQLWEPFWAGSPTIRTLVNRASGLCLDLYGNNSANGTIIQQYWCNGTSAQVWREDRGWF